MSDNEAVGGAGVQDGVTAVLYGMFTSFTEALDRFDQRLGAIEAALEAGPGEVVSRLGRIEQAVTGPAEPDGGSFPESAPASAEALQRQTELLDQRTAALSSAIAELRALLQAHVDESAHSLSRRAGEAGRRLAGDLGLRRPRPPSGGGGPPPATQGL